jgi:hypothetical protein
MAKLHFYTPYYCHMFSKYKAEISVMTLKGKIKMTGWLYRPVGFHCTQSIGVRPA